MANTPDDKDILQYDAAYGIWFTRSLDSSGSVVKTLYDANTILKADTDDTPVALTVAASTIVGRKATGNISAMSATESRVVLGLAVGDSPVFATVKLSGLTDDYIPYHVNDSTGLANGPTKTDVDDTITNKYPFWQILTGETVAVPARQQYSVFSRLDLQGTISLAAGAELAIHL